MPESTKELSGRDCVLADNIDRSSGYGYVSINGVRYMAHRLAFEACYGEIPTGLVVDHLCRNPSCVNPEHLDVVTIGENVLRGIGPTARNARKTHCPKGHDYSDPLVLHMKPDGSRTCKLCKHEAARARAEREGRKFLPRPNRRRTDPYFQRLTTK